MEIGERGDRERGGRARHDSEVNRDTYPRSTIHGARQLVPQYAAISRI